MRGRSTLIASLGALVAFASPAAAKPRPIGPPVKSWSVSKIERGVGKVRIDGHKAVKGGLDKLFDLGPAAFDLAASQRDGRAVGWVFAPPDHRAHQESELLAEAPVRDPADPRSVEGSVTHEDETQVYEREKGDKSLRLFTRVALEAIDHVGPFQPSECPVVGTAPCPVIRMLVRYRVSAWEVAGGHRFFDVGGAVYGEGHEHAWVVAGATDPLAHGDFWNTAQFKVKQDVDVNNNLIGRHLEVGNAPGVSLVPEIPLPRSLATGAFFAVKVSMEAETLDERGFESSAEAFIVDPPDAGPASAARAPKVKEPPVRPQRLARCPGGPRRHAGRLQLSSAAFSAGEETGTPMVLVTRRGGSRGAATVTLRTSGGTARSGRDFKRTRTRVRFENGDTSPRLVEIPIREDVTQESPESFGVSLAHARCAKLGKRDKATVTILDDDQAPPPPPPTFTIGGKVDGLQGSGLVLTNVGQELAVSANGSFTLPGTHTTNELYDLTVKAQPRNPDQLCTVQNGRGHVASANVTDIAVHCATVAPPTGLDPTFGDHGRVTVPGTGDAQAVLIQPDGHIVTVGSRQIGATSGFDFGATRHDAAGHLDPSFGTGGIAVTDLGGNDDHAFDAALLPDGGFVAVGQADPAGLGNTDFGLVRYTPDGHPDPAFDSDGIATDDLRGRNEGANAVAVQPDGKIVAAGFAEMASHIFDFALVRYNPNGTRDTSFGRNGVVTTDLGTDLEAATDIALQPDGKIVVVGGTERNATVLLARYKPDGTLDPTFNATGTVVSDIHTNIANGVAIMPDGTILVAGSRGTDAIVASYAPNGKLNSGFGRSGVAEADPTGLGAFGQDLALDSHGNIVVVGSANSTTVSDIALVRFTRDGTLDTAFAGDGFLTADVTGFGDSGNALAIDSQGRIVAAGSNFALIRANP